MRVLLFALLTVAAVTAQDGNGTGIDVDEALGGPTFRFKRQDAYEKICTPGVTTQEESTYCACSDDGSGWQCIAMASQIKIFSLLIIGSALVSLFSASFYAAGSAIVPSLRAESSVLRSSVLN